MYPISLDLKNRSCLVVGGGPIAERKIDGLLKEGAVVTVIAPTVTPGIALLVSKKEITLHLRAYQTGEATEYCLVIAATNDNGVNRRVFEDADRAGIFVNVADVPSLCSFHLPSRVERGALKISIASGGTAPFAVRRLRQMFERRLGPEWAEWMDAASRFRKKIRSLSLSETQAEHLYDTFFEATVHEAGLRARVPKAEEESRWIAAETADTGVCGSQETLFPHGTPSTGGGFVSLVGAGPGDPGLLTLKGKARLMRADAVVCDRLAQGALPCDLPTGTAIHFVGKSAGDHPLPQTEINAMLVRLAKAGKRVVRLKGGDPFVFGRGGEEVQALLNEGILFEVVPGVTAATAVPAYAGIPVTFRNEAVRVSLITAHEAVKSSGPHARWDLAAKDPHAVLLGYMGVSNIENVMLSLMENGMDPNMGAALIEQGTTSMQRSVFGTVDTLVKKAREMAIKSPALIVVGPTVAHAPAMNWFERRPLLGRRLVTFHSDRDFGEALDLAGAACIVLPLPITPAARFVMDALPLTGAIFFSRDEVDYLEEERDRKSWVKTPTAWCFTTEAAQHAAQRGWTDVRRVDNLSEISVSGTAEEDTIRK